MLTEPMQIGFERDGYTVRLAQDENDIRAALALRYRVFIEELGGDGETVDHTHRLEQDRFDRFADHLIVSNTITGDVIGTYRLMRHAQAKAAGGFYTDTEFNLEPLLNHSQDVLELGRSCVAADHRRGPAMFLMWTSLAQYVEQNSIETLFGVASFKGTDIKALAPMLSFLHHNHLAPEEMRPVARAFQSLDLMAPEQIDRRAAMIAMPALIKAYLRLGGMVGEGAYIDQAFNCSDVCMIMDTRSLNEQQARLYRGVGPT